MSDAVMVAFIGMIGSGIGSVIGIIANSRLNNYRLKKLEEKVDKHNNLIERTFKLEGQMEEVQHDIRDLKEGLR